MSSVLKKRPRRRESGVALILALAFIVLLTALIFAYFSRSTTDRNLSNSSFNGTSADTLARSAADIIIGDLKSEIVNSVASTATTVGNGAAQSVIYIPTSSNFMVPMRNLTSAEAAAMPNLVRRSVGSDPMTVPGIQSRASRVNSTTDPSANGRNIGLARWNKHYFIPRHSTTSVVDSTPISPVPAPYGPGDDKGFTAPDWVMVTSTNGPQVMTAPSADVIGRYAYAIYDEGGLLDVNAAGYPQSPNSTPLQSGQKTALAYADLTQIGMSPGEIDDLVGWRNYASLKTTGTFGNFSPSFTADTGERYANFVASETNGSLKVGTNVWKNRTDQAFVSRQQLLDYRSAEGFSQDALQYLTHFSRDLEQPSFVPNPGRPKVQNGGSSNISPFGTGNDANGSDRTATPAADINPPFLTVRVTTAFTRPDGSHASVGDPLVQKRFPLNRLAWITSNGPSASNMTDAVVRKTITALGGDPSDTNDPVYKFLEKGTSENILDSFGLTWRGGHWEYDHGNSSGILRLDQIKGLGREADFFELLKAAINVGSLGKASCYRGQPFTWTDIGSKSFLQQARDTQTQVQILQIGANIIDQSKGDNFPTRIRFSGASNYEVRGVQDLPYLYRMRNWVIRYGLQGNLGAILLQPELWNPHSTGSSVNVSNSDTPKEFRVRIGLDSTSSSTPMSLVLTYRSNPTPVDVSSAITFNGGGPIPSPLTFNAGEGNGYWGFREPTILMEANVPNTSHLSMADGGYVDFPAYPTGRTIIGFTVARDLPWFNPSAPANNLVNILPNASSPSNSCLRIYLEYRSPGGSWITYDEQPYQLDTNNININGLTTAQLQTISAALPSADWFGATRTDPRTSRWGIFTKQRMFSFPAIDSSNNVYATFRPDAGLSYASHIGKREDYGFVGGQNNYPAEYRGFQHGYWSENSVRRTFQSDGSGGNALLRYTVDPDGIPRRAMGGYWSDTANGGVTPSANPSVKLGLPMVTGNYNSRPTILHRPFRTVAELGYAFRDSPWGNISFSFPESGDSALLDVFCINETSSPTGLVAGRVNLNTRQVPVIQALISGALLDKDDLSNPVVSSTIAGALAAQLIDRTGGGSPKPLTNRADLVGAWTFGSDPDAAKASISSRLSSGAMDPDLYYSGYSTDIGKVTGVPQAMSLIPRQRESVIRALSNVGTARVWNLMIDIVAQSGRYPPGATTAADLPKFIVEGEQRYWVHVAIDRYTGKILDKQIEVVKE